MHGWLAVCLFFSFEGRGVKLVDYRFGAGQFNQHSFLHVRADGSAPSLEQPFLGTTQPTVPLSPMRQFLRCTP